MPFTFEDIAEYMRKKGVTDFYVAGYDDKNKFHFASSHGDPERIEKIGKDVADYIKPDPRRVSLLATK